MQCLKQCAQITALEGVDLFQKKDLCINYSPKVQMQLPRMLLTKIIV